MKHLSWHLVQGTDSIMESELPAVVMRGYWFTSGKARKQEETKDLPTRLASFSFYSTLKPSLWDGSAHMWGSSCPFSYSILKML